MGCICITVTDSVICPKYKKQNNARLHYLLKDDLMKQTAEKGEITL